jgi:hypothetical protein
MDVVYLYHLLRKDLIMACCIIGYTAKLFAAIGAINWGLVAFLNFNLVAYIEMLTGNKGIDTIIYGVVAAAGVYLVASCLFKLLKGCGHSCSCSGK